MPIRRFIGASLGASKAGLATVGYTLYGAGGQVAQARTTEDVQHLPGIAQGVYGVQAEFPYGFMGSYVFDSGDASPVSSDPVFIDFSSFAAAESSGGGVSGLAGTTLVEIMEAVHAILVAQLGPTIPEGAIVHTLEEDFLPTLGSPHFLITPGEQRANMPDVAGMGRASTGMDGSFRVSIRMQQARDTAYQDGHHLYDDSGIFKVCASLVEILHLYLPENGNGALLKEPMRLISMGVPTRPRGRDHKDWLRCDLSFSIKWRFYLSLSPNV